jgi:hypothetical protein
MATLYPTTITDKDETPSKYLGLVDGALGWIVEHLPDFDPFRGGRSFDLRNGQRVGELALLLQAYVLLTGNRQNEGIRQIASLLKSVLANREFSDRPLRSQLDFVLATQVYSALRTVGCEDARQRELLERLLRVNFVMHTERLPYRLMEVVFAVEWAGLSHSLPSMQSIYPVTLLGRTLCPLHLHDDDIYAITHVLMYLYALGTRSDNAVPAKQRNELNKTLSCLIVIACQDRHWDLLAELLICWDCLGNETTQIHKRAWRVLLDSQNKDGSIPGPEWAQHLMNASMSAKGTKEKEFHYFAHYYHTTLVGCICGCLRLKRLGENQRRPRKLLPSQECNS